MARLSGTRVLVTGGTSGLGRVDGASARAGERPGGGRVVTVSMSEQTMTRRGFIPYGPSGAAVEALARVMAADLADTPVTANILLPGGATATAMIPDEMAHELRPNLLEAAIMGLPIVWLSSPDAAGPRRKPVRTGRRHQSHLLAGRARRLGRFECQRRRFGRQRRDRSDGSFARRLSPWGSLGEAAAHRWRSTAVRSGSPKAQDSPPSSGI